MPTVSTISLTLIIVQYHLANFFDDDRAIVSHPERSSAKLVRHLIPHLNTATHLFTVPNDGAESIKRPTRL